jgi:hypothetical protein
MCIYLYMYVCVMYIHINVYVCITFLAECIVIGNRQCKQCYIYIF